MLDPNTLAQLTGLMARLEGGIELVVAYDDTPASAELRALVAQIVGSSPKIAVRETPDDAPVRRPSFGVARAGEAPRVRFSGLPLGHEFSSLVLALLQVSGYPPKIDEETRAAALALPAGQTFETFVSLSCHSCPDVVQALNILAALHPGVTAEMVDGALFAEEVEARKIMGVPAVFLNGQPFSQGRATLGELLAKLDDGAPARAAQKLAEAAPYDVLVVGGGPAGASAALYAARKGIRTAIVAERFGGQVSDTLGIENFVSVAYTEGPKLVSALEAHVRSVGVEIHAGHRVEALEAAGADGLHRLRLTNGATLQARAVVLAPGAAWRELGVPGEAAHKTRGVAFCPHCDGPLFKGKRVAVIGGGNSGVEAAIDLAGLASHVTLLEYDHQLRADAVLQSRLRSLPNVEVHTSAQTTAVLGDGQRVHGLAWTDRTTGAPVEAGLEGVFVQIGLLPNTGWLRGAVALSPRGEIEVDARGATSVPGVFAAGDATTVPFKQIVIAMGEGAKASLSAFDYLMRSAVAA